MVQFQEGQRLQDGGSEAFAGFLPGLVEGVGGSAIGFLRLCQGFLKLVASVLEGRGVEQRLREAVPFGDKFADSLHAVVYSQSPAGGTPAGMGRSVDIYLTVNPDKIK